MVTTCYPCLGRGISLQEWHTDTPLPCKTRAAVANPPLLQQNMKLEQQIMSHEVESLLSTISHIALSRATINMQISPLDLNTSIRKLKNNIQLDDIKKISYHDIGLCNVTPRSSTLLKLNFFTIQLVFGTFILHMTQLHSISNKTTTNQLFPCNLIFHLFSHDTSTSKIQIELIQIDL